jgi:hypothetical protein
MSLALFRTCVKSESSIRGRKLMLLIVQVDMKLLKY